MVSFANNYASKIPSTRRWVSGDLAPKVEMDRHVKELILRIPVPSIPSSFVKSQRATDSLERISDGLQRMIVGLGPNRQAGEFIYEFAQRFECLIKSYDLEQFHAAAPQTFRPSEVEKPLRSKLGQETIGVYSPVEIVQFIEKQARMRSVKFADFARQSFEEGLKQFDSRVWNEASSAVLEDFKNTLILVDGTESKQWSLRLSRKSFLKAIAFATEYQMSRSQLALLCVTHGARYLAKSDFESRFNPQPTKLVNS